VVPLRQAEEVEMDRQPEALQDQRMPMEAAVPMQAISLHASQRASWVGGGCDTGPSCGIRQSGAGVCLWGQVEQEEQAMNDNPYRNITQAEQVASLRFWQQRLIESRQRSGERDPRPTMMEVMQYAAGYQQAQRESRGILGLGL
jgi:hypothetical protein